MTLTTVQDFARMVATAVEDEREWSVVSGMMGWKGRLSEVVAMGERIRGESKLMDVVSCAYCPGVEAPFDVEHVKNENLEAGELKTSWSLNAAHSAVSKEEAEAMLKQVTIGMLLSSVKGAWEVSDELNQRFPEFKFESAEAFLGRVWKGRP
jgi:uncharacterized phage-like protein YoqJ